MTLSVETYGFILRRSPPIVTLKLRLSHSAWNYSVPKSNTHQTSSPGRPAEPIEFRVLLRDRFANPIERDVPGAIELILSSKECPTRNFISICTWFVDRGHCSYIIDDLNPDKSNRGILKDFGFGIDKGRGTYMCTIMPTLAGDMWFYILIDGNSDAITLRDNPDGKYLFIWLLE